MRGIGTLILTALAMVACGGGSSSSATNVQVVIGASGPLTGSVAAYGVGEMNGFQIALDEQNAQGGLLGHPVKMDSQDSKGDPAIAAQVAQKFVDEKVAGAVGDVLSTASLSMGPVYNRNNIPWVIASSSNPTITSHGWNNTFRSIFRDDQQGGFAGDYAYKTLQVKTAVIINDESAYAQGSGAAFQKSFTTDGGKVLSVEQITSGGKDYTSVLNKVKAENPDLIHYTGFYTEGAILVKEVRQLNIKAKLFWGAGTVDPTFNTIAGTAAQGVLVVGSPTPEQLPSAQPFVTEYKAKYGFVPGEFDAFAYDAMKAMLLAVKAAGSTDHAAIISALRRIDFPGATGEVKFDSRGDRTQVPFNVSVYNAQLQLVPYQP